jgi:hypothetical protein
MDALTASLLHCLLRRNVTLSASRRCHTDIYRCMRRCNAVARSPMDGPTLAKRHRVWLFLLVLQDAYDGLPSSARSAKAKPAGHSPAAAFGLPTAALGFTARHAGVCKSKMHNPCASRCRSAESSVLWSTHTVVATTAMQSVCSQAGVGDLGEAGGCAGGGGAQRAARVR